jgi:hypothetical protein
VELAVVNRAPVPKSLFPPLRSDGRVASTRTTPAS